MPYKSRAQAAYFNIHKKELAKQGVDVNEWNDASKGLKLPKHVKSYEHGGEVTETGLALLHAGEHVVPKDNKMADMKELMGAALGSGKPKKKKAKLHMQIHKMSDGKFHVQHTYHGGEEPMPESSEHAPANLAELKAHMDQHYGAEEAEGAAEPEGAEQA